MNLIGFTAWNDENYSLIGDFEDEHLTQDEIEWKNYEEEIMAWGYLISEALGLKQDESASDMTWCKWAYWVEPDEFVLPHGEEPDNSFHWKNDPLTKSIVERYMKGRTSI